MLVYKEKNGIGYYVVKERGWRCVFFDLTDCHRNAKQYPESVLSVAAALVKSKIEKEIKLHGAAWYRIERGLMT